MDEYKISLGVELDTSDIISQIGEAERKVDPIKIKIDAETKELTNTIKAALNTLSKGAKNSLTLDTSKIESSFKDVASVIKDIKTSLGTLDSKSGMKDLLASINQIVTALEKASNQFNELNVSLNSLASKDFSVNFGINMGGSNNPIGRNAAYGSKVRNETLPQLKQQMDALVKYYNDIYKGSLNEFEVLQKLVSGTKLNSGDFFETFLFGKDSVATRMNGGSLSGQMQAYKQYIDMFRQAASLKGLDLSSVTSGFSKSTDELIKDAQDIQTGAKEAQEGVERLKGVFGASIDADALTAQLTPIVEKLEDIRVAINNLSNNDSIGGLTTSFDKLSDALETLLANAKQAQDILGVGGTNIDSSKEVQNTADIVVQAEERKQQAIKETRRLISDSTQSAIDAVTSKSIDRAFEVDEDESLAFKREMENLVRQWTDSKGKLTDIKINTETFYDSETGRNIERISRAQVTYNNELGETIKKTIALRQIDSESGMVDGKEKVSPVYGFVEVAGQYSKSLGKTKTQTDAFVKQQKQAVANLTNQINQMNRTATDQNAAKPIKLDSHLTSLANKYNEITAAIQRMESASSDTFVDEQNNVKRLISEFKSLVSEYKNAENVSTKMKGTDLQSGVNIALNDFKKFKADAKDFPQMVQTIDKLRTALNNVGDSSSLNKFNDQLRVARSELAKIKSETAAANRSEKVGINVSGLQSKIADLQRISPEINEFKTNVKGAEVTVESLLSDLSRVNTQSDFSIVNSRFKAFADAAKTAGIALDETAKIAQKAKDKLRGDDGKTKFDVEIGDVETKFAKLSNQTAELSEIIGALRHAFSNVKTANAEGDINEIADAYKKYEQILQDVCNQLTLTQQAEERARKEEQRVFSEQSLETAKIDALSRLESLFEQGSEAARIYGTRVEELKRKIDECGDTKGIADLNKQITTLGRTINKSNVSTNTFAQRFKKQWSQYSSYFSVASIFMHAEQGIRSMFEQVKLIDSAMTELKKVTNETDESYNRFLSNAASRAKELGTTIDGLVSSTADFARLGYSFEESQGLAEVANIYAVVGDEIEGVEDATQSLVSTLAAFRHEIGDMSNDEFALSIVDKMNEVANNYAISSGGLGQALQRSASSMAAANNSLDETIALITAANEVAQNPEKVGKRLCRL